MLNPDIQTLEALVRIQANADWRVIRKWIDDSFTTTLGMLVCAGNEVKTRWYQGKIQELSNIRQFLDGAQVDLERIKESGEREGQGIEM